jgi:hypothetical protein
MMGWRLGDDAPFLLSSSGGLGMTTPFFTVILRPPKDLAVHISPMGNIYNAVVSSKHTLAHIIQCAGSLNC